jgi:inhibitor of cysteine peptidase
MQVKTLEDDGGTAELRVGEALAIRLPELASAGYRWAADGDGDGDGIVALSPPRPATAAGAIGSAGEIAIEVRAQAPGETEVKLKYWRDWEGDASIRRRFALTIRVLP